MFESISQVNHKMFHYQLFLPMIEKCVLVLALLLCVQGQAFAGLNLDPSLVASTNNAMSNLRGVLALYTCSGSTLFEGQNSGQGMFNSQRYVLYSIVQTVVSNLDCIVRALRANNIVQGSNNIVQGSKNILIGNNDIVRGNNLWVFSCTNSQFIGGGSEMLLILGNFRIDLKNINAIMYNPSAAIQCLDPNQSRDYFALFGVQGVPSHLAGQLSQIKLLI